MTLLERKQECARRLQQIAEAMQQARQVMEQGQQEALKLRGQIELLDQLMGGDEDTDGP